MRRSRTSSGRKGIATSIVALRVRLPCQNEDIATAELWEAGTLGIEVSTTADQALLVAYFRDRVDLEPEIQKRLSVLGAEVEPAPVAEVDWVARFREGFRAFSLGPFHIVPAWEDPSPGPVSSRVTLRVDPGQAFGTGTHETTQLCLLALAELAQRSPLGRVLDLGCGTGILGIAASKLGAKDVTALDSDPEAVASARRHASLNDVSLDFVVGDGGASVSPGRFDLIVANLTLPLLLEKDEEVRALTTTPGRLLLSGFLLTDLPEIQASYGREVRLEVRTCGEWAAVVTE